MGTSHLRRLNSSQVPRRYSSCGPPVETTEKLCDHAQHENLLSSPPQTRSPSSGAAQGQKQNKTNQGQPWRKRKWINWYLLISRLGLNWKTLPVAKMTQCSWGKQKLLGFKALYKLTKHWRAKGVSKPPSPGGATAPCHIYIIYLLLTFLLLRFCLDLVIVQLCHQKGWQRLGRWPCRSSMSRGTWIQILSTHLR